MEMIDNTKMWQSILSKLENSGILSENFSLYMDILTSLEEQGLTYRDGIIQQKGIPVRIEEGRRYLCIKAYEYRCDNIAIRFERGCIYDSNRDGNLVIRNGDISVQEELGDNVDEYFRPITEEVENKLKDVDEWLDKKLTHKLKFQAGDWIVYADAYVDMIKCIRFNHYFLNNSNFMVSHDSEKFMRKWKIEDAMDGDILVSRGNSIPSIFVFRDVDSDRKKLGSYIGIDLYGDLKTTPSNLWTCSKIVTPATNEEIEKLMNLLKEKGYLWNEKEKILLKTIEPLNSKQVNDSEEEVWSNA